MPPTAAVLCAASASAACSTSTIERLPEGVRRLAHDDVAHYHAERNHQGLGNKLIAAENDNAANGGRVARRQRLGGVLSYYHREAA